MSKSQVFGQASDSDGIYIAYFSGEYGTSLGMFTFKGGVICGADLGGGVYDGILKYSSIDQHLSGSITFSLKGGGTTITGAYTDLPVSYDTFVRLKTPVDGPPFHALETLSGPVNVRFEKVRSL